MIFEKIGEGSTGKSRPNFGTTSLINPTNTAKFFGFPLIKIALQY